MNDATRSVDHRAWRLPCEAVLDELGVDPMSGLSADEACRRLARFGANRLQGRRRRGALRILVDQLRGTVVALLSVAALLSFWLGGPGEGIAILAVIAINTAIGFLVEFHAVRSMDALRALGSLRCRVRRDGLPLLLPAAELVPGDILVLEAGDTVPADARLIAASRLRADESSFTGESVPVDKQADALPRAERVEQQSNMIFRGTSLTMGSCEAVVVATGMQTELGRIAELAASAGSETTPLEQQLARVGNRLIGLTILITLLVTVLGVMAGKPLRLMIETGVALAVATIPEGLPIVATVALAAGLWRMSRRHALINRLAAVETLGSTTIICTDKTGTLTENQLRVARLLLPAGEVDFAAGEEIDRSEELREALEIGVLCNRAALGNGGAAVGDPLELALLAAGRRVDLERDALIEVFPDVGSEAFDSVSKMMATYHARESGLLVAVKGAPEAVIARCSNVGGSGSEAAVPLDAGRRESWLARSTALAAQGLRVIALARKRSAEMPEDPYDDLTLLALVALNDPPRIDVRKAIEQCHAAGIRVLMITGDHPATAARVARDVGLGGELCAGELPPVALGERIRDLSNLSQAERDELCKMNLFARVSPAEKLNLVRLHQAQGAVVGMIGDGVNDAPALEQADIGIAMGKRGTQVAREAAAMVLVDDAFDSIVAAVMQGRVIFGNIRKFVLYLLSCNLSEVLVLAIASALKTPLPILPLQILFLNLVSDIFPALALGVGGASEGLMRRPPRDGAEGILMPSHARWIAGFGGLITLSVLTAFYLCLGPLELGREQAVTVAFLTLACGQLWHVFNMHDAGAPAVRNEVSRNPFVWLALLLCAALIGLAVYLPGLAALLELHRPTRSAWSLVVAFSLLPLLVGRAIAWLRSRRRR